MLSTSRSAPRRRPQQARAAERQACFLQSAAVLFAKKGYDGTTMTAVAEHAHASIGALYDYFPDKHALASALTAKYVEEGDTYWPKLFGDVSAGTAASLAQCLVDGILEFVRERPAFPMLLGAVAQLPRTPAARQPLRSGIAHALRKRDMDLTPECALFHAEIVVELLKALLSVYGRLRSNQRVAAVACFRRLLAAHFIKMPCPGE